MAIATSENDGLNILEIVAEWWQMARYTLDRSSRLTVAS